MKKKLFYFAIFCAPVLSFAQITPSLEIQQRSFQYGPTLDTCWYLMFRNNATGDSACIQLYTDSEQQAQALVENFRETAYEEESFTLMNKCETKWTEKGIQDVGIPVPDGYEKVVDDGSLSDDELAIQTFVILFDITEQVRSDTAFSTEWITVKKHGATCEADQRFEFFKSSVEYDNKTGRAIAVITHYMWNNNYIKWYATKYSDGKVTLDLLETSKEVNEDGSAVNSSARYMLFLYQNELLGVLKE